MVGTSCTTFEDSRAPRVPRESFAALAGSMVKEVNVEGVTSLAEFRLEMVRAVKVGLKLEV